MNTFNLDLDLSKTSTNQVIIMRQCDHLGTTIVADLYDHGQHVTGSNLTVEMVMALPDKRHYYRKAASYSNGTITHAVDETYACSVAGRTNRAYFELKNSSGDIFSTQSFSVIILPSGTAGMAAGQSYDDEIRTTIIEWLDEHPEATTTVQDNSLSDAKLMKDSVTTVKIKDKAVTTDKLDDSAVTEDKLADGSVTTTKLANRSVTTQKIVNNSVTDDKLDPNGVLYSVSVLRDRINNLEIDIDADDLGLEQDEDTGLVYPTYKGVRSENGIPLAASGGGGGGGGSGNAAVISMVNTTGWLSRTISTGESCTLSVEWSSIENGTPTGPGTLTVTVSGIVKRSLDVEQGSVSVDVTNYVSTGTNRIKVKVTDVYGNSRVITFTVGVAELRMTSSFDTSGTFSAGQQIDFTYTPTGSVDKTVHFLVDNAEVATASVTTSGRQQTQKLPAMNHGAHSIRAYFSATIDGQEVRSNELYFDIIVVNPSSLSPIVSCGFSRTTAKQYETLMISYTAYTPNSLTSEVELTVNGAVVNSLTVDRTEHIWAYRCDRVGSVTLKVSTGTASRTITLNVTESEIDAHAETDALALHLTSYGRSNDEANPNVWEDPDTGIAATMTGFNFVSNGWLPDDDGMTVLRVSGNARVTIPYKPFAQDFRTTGKTLEFEFATRNILDYDGVVVSCMSGGRGFQLTAQMAQLASEQTTVSTQYKEDEHVRISFVVDKRTEDKLIYVYINGIMSGVVQYPDDDDFAQSNPVGITIGSSLVATDIYCIRVYDNNLTRFQLLDNWIADTQDIALMLDRYSHNDVYDEYGAVTIDKLPSDLPYMIISCAELPQYKGDKKTVSGIYVDPVTPSKSFTFEKCQANVQGTSSAPYARKNYDMQFKGGFEMDSGDHMDNYALAQGVIPFNRFVLKADVASSESANNVELTMLYNDVDPYKRPEQIANPMVRKGIYGFPIVVFWENTDTNEITFMGKYNFNLPKRAPTPYGYTGDMESWEFQNNTSDLMLFLTDYFDETMVVDPTTGDAKEAWLYDYEARFPEDTWNNYAKLQELESFVYSTYRANATNATLPASYTDVDGNVHTKDTSAYRLAKFRTEFGNYAEIESFLFYYIFTELFLMVDSRAKNLFIGFSGGDTTGLTAIDRKAVAEPYDMDTAIGTNNEGSLVFGYNYEDTDHLSGGADVYNGQNSVLWCNVRDAFPSEIVQLYQRLRSAGTLSYASVEKRFEDHQSKWPEAIFNEDAVFKYIDPLTNPDPGKAPTAVYLPMMQGSKAEQRKWWLYNRFRYIDSKYNAGDALLDVIQVRGYAKSNVTVTPYADIYPAVKYGSYLVTERGARGRSTTLVCPLDNVNDTEIYIYSASQLASVGDLSGLKVGFADFSMATRLQSIKVGSAASGYVNLNLTELHVGSNPLLGSVDARNCTALTGTIDLSGASNIEHVYLEGTSISSINLPVGGILKTLHLPATVTNLTVRGQAEITSFSMPDYSGISTLRVENCGTAIPVLDILDNMAPNSRVRIIGFTMAVTSTSEVELFFDYLDTMRGLDESGNNVDTAVVAGNVTGLGTITGAWLAQMNARYPNVNISYQHINSTLTYKSYDGSTTLYTQTVTDGGNGTYSGTPSRTSTAQYTYTFVGWSLEQNQTVADPNATKAVKADRTVYAAYTATVRTYTITWKNRDNTVLETDQNVPYGSTPTYNGSTPTYNGQRATGWSPAVSSVTGNQTYTATYLPQYRVRFYNGNIWLQESYVTQGQDAVYSGATPTKDGFEFIGWDKPLTNIQAATNFYARFRDTRSLTLQYVAYDTITDVDLSTVKTVRSSAFAYRSSLATVSLPACVSVSDTAFRYCNTLTTVNLPACTDVGGSAFQYCRSLTSVSLPACTSVGTYAFNVCSALTSIDLPSCTRVWNYAFQGCTSLTTVNLPACNGVETCVFSGCHSLTTVNLPVCSYVGYSAFQYCRSLASIDLPACSYVGSSAFYGCYSLVSLYLTGVSKVPTLGNSSVFRSTPIGGYSASAGQYGSVYVPASLYDSFLTATYWSLISSRIVSVA